MIKDYNHPDPLPDDLFIKFGIPVEHGYFILGTKGTGILFKLSLAMPKTQKIYISGYSQL